MTNVTAPALFQSSLGSGQPNDGADTQAPKANTDFRSFLTLLTAQLRNQDPMKPMESTEFVAQLANFSTVEQLIGTNDRLDGLSASGDASSVAALGGWIGKDVASSSGGFRATGEAVRFHVREMPTADRMVAHILDETGAPLRSFEIGPLEEGQATWDGLAANGLPVSPQDLRVEIEYQSDGTVITRKPGEVFQTIVAIRATPEGVALQLDDGRSLSPQEISHLRAPTAPGI